MKQIKQWNPDDRPREKLLKHGVRQLSNAELLAILLGSGSVDQDAVSLARAVMQAADNNLGLLARKEITELTEIKGIGPAKAVTITAALELGNRKINEQTLNDPGIQSSKDAYRVLAPIIQDLNHEEVWALILNRANKVLHKLLCSKGGVSSSIIDNQLIMREALRYNASAIVLGHNHPSGQLRPSESDIALTYKLYEACELMNITLVDHLIITQEGYYSFKDYGKL